MTLFLLIAHLALRAPIPGPSSRTIHGGAEHPHASVAVTLVRGVRVVAGGERATARHDPREPKPSLTNLGARAYVPAPQILLEYSP
jgi:hypothetical protein